MSPERTLIAYADGACEPINPGGTASWGLVIYEHGREIVTRHGVVARGPMATNNVAEFAAAWRALEEVKALDLPRGSHLTLKGDSMLWVRMLSGSWRVRTPTAAYVPYFERARTALKQLRRSGVLVDLQWVPRAQNQRADDLSKAANHG